MTASASANSSKAHKSYLRFGIKNVFDRDPPLSDEDRTYMDEDANPGRFFYVDWRFML